MKQKSFAQGLARLSWVLALVWPLTAWPPKVWSQGNESASQPAPVATMTVQQPSLSGQAGGSQVLAGQVSVSLSPVLVQAIERGVTLTFLSEFKMYKPRWWWFVDEEVGLVVRHARLTFHPLTRQFRVSVDGSKPQAFTDLTEALKACLAVNGWTVLQAPMAPGHYAQIRLSLDTSALPKALHVTALTNESWALSTGWVGVVTP
ncbi:MAG: DUF4390 domain-containing protein [Burkholderiaceae bacterium]